MKAFNIKFDINKILSFYIPRAYKKSWKLLDSFQFTIIVFY